MVHAVGRPAYVCLFCSHEVPEPSTNGAASTNGHAKGAATPPTGSPPPASNPPPAPPPPSAKKAKPKAAARSSSVSSPHSSRAIFRQLVEVLQASNHFGRDAAGQLHVYQDGVYSAEGRRHCEREIIAFLRSVHHGVELWSTRLVGEVCEFLTNEAPAIDEVPSERFLNVRNGLVYVDSGKLHPHDPLHRTAIQLPVVFDPAARCPKWERFVADVFPADCVAAGVPWEIVALAMMPTSSIQKAVLLEGEGANGKSVFVDALIAFIGNGNVSGLSLQQLEERFARVALLGKLANLCSDLPAKALSGSSVFKAVVSGDLISGEVKYGNPFTFRPFARLIFAANHLPTSSDVSFAFFRRFLVVPFERTFDEKAPTTKRREVLDAELSEPGELSGVLNKALAVLPRIRAHGMTETPSMKAALDEFRDTTDFIRGWISRACVEGPAQVSKKSELVRAYNAEAMKDGHPLVTAIAFGKALKRHRPKLIEKQHLIGTDRVWCWEGIALKAPFLP